jgi:hypothetical protein
VTRPPLIIEGARPVSAPAPRPAIAPLPPKPPWGMSLAQWDVFCALIDREKEAQDRTTRLEVQLLIDTTGTLARAAARMRNSPAWRVAPAGGRVGSVYRGRARKPAATVFTGQLITGEINT